MAIMTPDFIHHKSDALFQVLAKPDLHGYDLYVTNEKIEYMISVFLIVALNFLPILANDYPS